MKPPRQFTFIGTLLALIFASLFAQDAARITSVSITPTGLVRLVVQRSATNADNLFLEGADSPLGPWHKEPDTVRNPVAEGWEFLTPHRAYFPQRYYRFSLFTHSLVAAQSLPYIRYLAPNSNIKPGQLASLYGANFSPNPPDNTVTFELGNGSWIATVKEAATNYLILQVPTNLVANGESPTEYRVSVKTAQGQGNGVRALVQTSFENFSIRPDDVYIPQPAGSGTQTLIVGGGTPPYKLLPLSANDQKIATVTLEGPVLTVTASANVKFGSITISVQDSSPNFPRTDIASAGVVTIPYQPKLSAQFHTLLAGTEPGLTLNATLAEFSQGNFQTEKLALELQNLQLDLSHLLAGDIFGLLQLYDPGGPYYYGFQHLLATAVSAQKVSFDVVSLDEGATTTVAQGSLIKEPPTIIIDTWNSVPASLVPQPLTLQLVLADQIIRLPPQPGANFAIVAHFTSVSAREDTYLPQQSADTNRFTTIGLPSGAPSIERLIPPQGEIYRIVRLRGAALPLGAAASNSVTFAGTGGTRVPAKILATTDDEIILSVPPDAITGPVRVSVGDKLSNDFLFSVRFRPDSSFLLDQVALNTSTTFQLSHQQPQDEGETSDERTLQSLRCTLKGGHLTISNLSSNQQAGTVVVTSSYVLQSSTNSLFYVGQESTGLKRHVFRQLPSVSSRFVLASLYCSESADGVLLELFGGDGIFGFNAGIAYQFQMSVPIFTPAEKEISIRLEAISQPFTSIPGNEMRVIWNSVQRAP